MSRRTLRAPFQNTSRTLFSKYIIVSYLSRHCILLAFLHAASPLLVQLSLSILSRHIILIYPLFNDPHGRVGSFH